MRTSHCSQDTSEIQVPVCLFDQHAEELSDVNAQEL